MYNLIFRMNKKMKITTMFISKKPTRSNREIKRSIFKHWRNLTISMKISLKIFSSTYSHLARKKNDKKECFEVAKKKIQTIEVFIDLAKKQREFDIDMVSVFYRDLFVRAVEKVMVIVRIGKIIQEYGDKKKIYQFKKTEESILYRKFLETWDDYWDPDRIFDERNSKMRERKLWREQVDIFGYLVS